MRKSTGRAACCSRRNSAKPAISKAKSASSANVDIIEIWKPSAHDKWVGDVTADLDDEIKALIRFGGFLGSEFET